ncbi:MAG: NAD-dependent epimerase/dehydratase family protein [Woeseiaceae bacterium]
MTATVLIAGNGYTGAALKSLLKENASNVVSLARRPSAAPHVLADLDDPATLGPAITASEALRADPLDIVYLAPPKTVDGVDVRLMTLLNNLPSSSIRRLIVASTTGVYGDHKGQPVTEQMPLNPMTERAKNRVALEQTARQWCDEHEVGLSLFRIAGIYGPGRLPTSALERGDPLLDPTFANPGNRIHVDDLAGAIVAALNAASLPPIVNIADGDHMTSTAFALLVAETTGIKPPPLISREEAENVYSPMRLSFLNESRRIDNRVLTDQLGYVLRYPNARSGIEASLKAESASS